MSNEALKTSIERDLSDSSLIVVSNRQPYSHKKSGANIKVDRPAGGLTSAMDEALRETGGTWVAWGSGPEDREAADGRSRVQVPPRSPRYTLKRVWLSPEEVDNYYHGYSNHVLWPLCHIALDRVYFRKKYWEDYQAANSRFAQAVLEEASDRSVVWIHDYHLCLVPELLRQKRPGLTIAHFWHIPWPNFSVFRICPQAGEIIKALLSNDLIGFQIPLFVHNFMECVRESVEDAEIDYDNHLVRYGGHETRLKAFPISVDFEKFDALASSKKTTKAMLNLMERYSLSDKLIGVGVDRLEYTKGLIKRFQAIDLFFDRYPQYREQFTFVQIAVPTRLKEPYVSYKATVEAMVRKINRKYASQEWNPIVYRDTKSEHEDLAAYYRMADVAIISSIYDGMNLVAKEFIASQVEEKGTLLLSEFAGAAEELEGAILVNPYDTEDFCDSIRKVLHMSAEEKQCRIAMLRRHVKECDIYHWMSDFLHDVSSARLRISRTSSNVFEHIEKIPRNNVFLFLDYDGTLTPIVDSPEQAVLSTEMSSLVSRLKDVMPVSIITGRALSDIMGMVNMKDIFYAGNHGAELWNGERVIHENPQAPSEKLLHTFLSELRKNLSSIRGALVEDKGLTASIHFRMVSPEDICRFDEAFWSVAGRYGNSFRITSGKKVLEIRPRGSWNKGDAVLWILKRFGNGKVPLYIGDDVTDEDAYRAIRGQGISISIDRNSEAEYYVSSQKDVSKFLKWLGNF